MNCVKIMVTMYKIVILYILYSVLVHYKPLVNAIVKFVNIFALKKVRVL